LQALESRQLGKHGASFIHGIATIQFALDQTASTKSRIAFSARSQSVVFRRTTTEARKDAATEKRDATYAIAKEECDAFADEAKAKCIKDAEARYGQP
jgi:hypothetical protein